MIDITGLREDKRPQSSTVVHALLDRLEAAESALSNLGVTPEEAKEGLARHKATLARLEAAEKERDALRAKIEQMELQEPIAWRTFDGEGGYDYRSYEDNENYKLRWEARYPNLIGWVEPLYALPGAQAQPAPIIPEGWKLVPIEPTPSMAASVELSTANSVSDIYRAMLAAAPEVKK